MKKFLKINCHGWDEINDIGIMSTYEFENPKISNLAEPGATYVLVEGINKGIDDEVIYIPVNGVGRISKLYMVLDALYNKCNTVFDCADKGLVNWDIICDKNGEIKLEIFASIIGENDKRIKISPLSMAFVSKYDSFKEPIDDADRVLSNPVGINGDILTISQFVGSKPLLVFDKVGNSFEYNLKAHHAGTAIRSKTLEEKVAGITEENKHEEQFTDSVGKENDIVTFTNQKESDNINVLFEVVYGESGGTKSHSVEIGLLPLINVVKLVRNPSDKEEIPTVGILNFLYPGHPTQPGKLVKLLFRPHTKHRVYKNCTKSDFVAIAKDFADFLTLYFKELTRYEFRTRITKIRLEFIDATVYAKATDIDDRCVYSSTISSAIEFVNTVVSEDDEKD